MLKSSEPQNRMRSGSEVRDDAIAELYRRCGVTTEARMGLGSLKSIVPSTSEWDDVRRLRPRIEI
jgi:hypothetical protein